MNILIYADNTMPIQIRPLVDLLNSMCHGAKFQIGKEKVRLPDPVIRCPESYTHLDKKIRAEIKTADLTLIATSIPYENNFFFEEHDDVVIVSFSGWNLLTDLPISNGLAYFVASMISDTVGVGATHDENTGCINDFWWDKKGIDVGMRSAYICGKCMKSSSDFSSEDKIVLEDLVRILNAVSNASRLGRDIVEVAPTSSSPNFDVFMSHNSADKPAVRRLSGTLADKGVRVWLDEEQLPPGRPWQPLLEKQISEIRAAAVCVGPNGIGPWQDVETRAFLSEFVRRGAPVIPVLLPDSPAVPDLPLFLQQMTWVDMQGPKVRIGQAFLGNHGQATTSLIRDSTARAA